MNFCRCLATFSLFATVASAWGDLPSSRHSLDNFARSVLESYRKGDFPAFYRHTVFAMPEDHYKNFLLGVRNDNIRNHLTKDQWSQWEKEADLAENSILKKFKDGVLDKEKARENLDEIRKNLATKWKEACIKEWRNSHSRLKALGSASIREEAFVPILRGAEKERIQWETVEVTAIEVLHHVSADKAHFNIDGFVSPILYWQPGLTYRLQFEVAKTHGRSLRFSTLPEGPIVYEPGTLSEAASGDLVARFKTSPEKLNYFCPDQKGMGNQILFSYGEQEPRLNVLVTFTYGNRLRNYRILLRDCLPIPSSASASASEAWNRWLLFERPVWLGAVLKKPSPE